MALDQALVSWLREDIEDGNERDADEALSALSLLGCGDHSVAFITALEENCSKETEKKRAEKCLRQLKKRIEGRQEKGRSDFDVRKALNSTDASLKVQALFKLGSDDCGIDKKEVFEIAVNIITSEKNAWIKAAAVRLIGLRGEKDSCELLLRTLAVSDQSVVQAEVFRSLRSLDYETAAELSAGFLDHRFARLGRLAMETLMQSDQKKALELIETMLRSLKRPRRELALKSLSTLDCQHVDELVLHAFLIENDFDLMKKEAEILTQRSPRSAIGAIGFLRRSMDERVAELATKVYDKLLKLQKPSQEEIEKLESDFIEKRRERQSKAITGKGEVSGVIDDRGNSPKKKKSNLSSFWSALVFFTALVVIFAFVAAALFTTKTTAVPDIRTDKVVKQK